MPKIMIYFEHSLNKELLNESKLAVRVCEITCYLKEYRYERILFIIYLSIYL